MKKSRFTESRIFSILKESEAGIKTADICRMHGIAESTYYSWKAKYGGSSVSIIKQMRELKHDLSQHKRMYAEKAFEREALRDAISKKL